MNKKNILIVILGSIVAFLILFAVMYKHDINYRTLTTDSGFDSSWDSGGWDSGGWDSSSSWGSDWGSSSDYDYDWDWGSSDSGSGSSYHGSSSMDPIVALLTIGGIFGFAGVIVIIFLVASVMNEHTNKKVERSRVPAKPYIPSHSVLSDYEVKLLEEFGYTEEKFLQEAYKVYVNIQGAWANNDIDSAKDYVSNEIYNQYKSQLSTLIMKKQRNVMSDFSYVKGLVNKVRKEEEDGIVIGITLNVNCKDYLLNETSNTVERGDKEHLWDYIYEMAFELHKDGKKIINNCPNCNAKLKGKGATVKCEYCGSDIVRKAPSVVMIDKKMTYQR